MIISRLQTDQQSFARQLSIALLGGLTVLVVLMSSTVAWFVSERLTTNVYDQSRVITKLFSENSILMLLVPWDSQVAHSITQTFNAFPSVKFVQLVNQDLKNVLTVGPNSSEWVLSVQALPIDEVMLVHDGACCWHFIAPVETVEAAPSEVEFAPPASMRLGYIHVAFKKAPTQALIHTIIISHLVIAVILTIALGSVLLRRIRLMTEPLVALERVMVRGIAKQGHVRAPIVGPLEVQSIATVFNSLMASRESQSASLEQLVRERTRELELARDEALQAEREKYEIMSMFTHEMKAPLHAIDAYLRDAASQLDFIRDKLTAQRIRSALQIIGVQSGELLHRINQILELRSLEAGNATVDMVEIHLPSMLSVLDNTLRPLAIKNGNSLTFTLIGDENIIFDYAKLLHIIENLISNACRFTQDGLVCFDIECKADWLRLQVKDTGIGIASEHHDNIFNAFYQVDMSDTREHAGTGLGLAIVKKLTDFLSGSIVIDSAIGQGTRIEITLPLPMHKTEQSKYN